MMIKSKVESVWVENMGQFLYYLDPNTRKLTRTLEKIKLKIIKCSIVFNKTCLNYNLLPQYTLIKIYIAQLARAVEYTDCFSAEG